MRTLLLATAYTLSIVASVQAQSVSMTPMVSCYLGFRSYNITTDACKEMGKLYLEVTYPIRHGDTEIPRQLIYECYNKAIKLFPDNRVFVSNFCRDSYTDFSLHNSIARSKPQ